MSGERRRVVIVGASAAGLRCACRLARLRPSWEVTVLERRDTFSWAACGLPYVLSGDIDEADALRRTQDGALRDEAYFAAVKGVTVLAGHEVFAVDTAKRVVRVRAGRQEIEVGWDELVLATGARARKLPGQAEHARVCSFHTPEDLARLHHGLTRREINRVVLIGGGLVGCELAEAFRGLWGCEVTLVEAAGHVLPGVLDVEMAAVAGRALERHGVRIRAGLHVDAIDTGEAGAGVRIGDDRVEGDVVVVAVGVDPAVGLARRAGARLGASGAIVVDERMATSLPNVWAAGDCVEVRHAVAGAGAFLPLGSLANRQGRCLANVLAGRADRFPPVAGAVAVKIFDCNVAATGITRNHAERLGLAARSVWLVGHDSAHYWPEAKEIVLHLVYESGSGRLLGVQAVGEGEVAKRVDVVTQLIVRGGTLDDLAHVEHAYAPPYAPALDPLAVLAFVAQNREDGIVGMPPSVDLAGVRVLDVRHPDESETRPVGSEDVVLAPLESLRAASQAGGDDPLLVVCERGTRSAEAVRWLRSCGVDASYLGGGLRLRSRQGSEDGE